MKKPSEEYADVIAKIKHAAESEFGEEVEIFVDGRQTAVLPNRCWQLRQIDCSHISGPDSDLPFYRLDVQRGDINSYSILNPRKDITEEAIKQKFVALNISYEEYKNSISAPAK